MDAPRRETSLPHFVPNSPRVAPCPSPGPSVAPRARRSYSGRSHPGPCRSHPEPTRVLPRGPSVTLRTVAPRVPSVTPRARRPYSGLRRSHPGPVGRTQGSDSDGRDGKRPYNERGVDGRTPSVLEEGVVGFFSGPRRGSGRLPKTP